MLGLQNNLIDVKISDMKRFFGSAFELDDAFVVALSKNGIIKFYDLDTLQPKGERNML